jgi:hypothetical protein
VPLLLYQGTLKLVSGEDIGARINALTAMVVSLMLKRKANVLVESIKF